MTLTQLQQKEEKSTALRVFQVTSGDYYVESSNGKVCYRVSLDNGNSACTCGDFNGNIQKDQHYICKHIMTAMRFSETGLEPKLDKSFIVEIQGTPFVKYAGLLDIATRRGIRKLLVECFQHPTKENGYEAICKAHLISKDGQEFIEWGDASPQNVNSRVAKALLRVAATRSKGRCLRDFCNIGIVCIDEVDFDEVTEAPQKAAAAEKSNVRQFRKPPKEEKDAPADKKPDTRQSETHPEKDQEKEKEPAQREEPQKKEQPQGQTTDTVVKIATAQMAAIINLAKRRGLTEQEIRKRVSEKFNVNFEEMNSSDAKGLIRQLQQSG